MLKKSTGKKIRLALMLLCACLTATAAFAAANSGSSTPGNTELAKAGLAESPVILNYPANNWETVGYGSYLVNVAVACTACHSAADAKSSFIAGTCFGSVCSSDLRPDAYGQPAGLDLGTFIQVMRSEDPGAVEGHAGPEKYGYGYGLYGRGASQALASFYNSHGLFGPSYGSYYNYDGYGGYDGYNYGGYDGCRYGRCGYGGYYDDDDYGYGYNSYNGRNEHHYYGFEYYGVDEFGPGSYCRQYGYGYPGNMPWGCFKNMNDGDLQSIYSYLQAAGSGKFKNGR